MDDQLKNLYSTVLKKIITKYTEVNANTIFVFTGISPYIHIEAFSDHLTDKETFDKDGTLDLFSQEWFGRIFPNLSSATTFQILSHQQYANINEYLNEDYFKNRVVIVYDNLRSLYPINEQDYIEKSDANGTEVRPDNMPVYQAEQMKIGQRYYYSLKKFNDELKREPLFSKRKELTSSEICTKTDARILDVISDPYGIDVMVNTCIEECCFLKQVIVKVSDKNKLNSTTLNTLQELNQLLANFGGGIYKQAEEAVQKQYHPSEESLCLLKKFWGENATFRDIQIYENPEINNTIIPVSQGLLVDTIIKEYKNGREGIQPRDIFITAPTGAGKSLIFQLPAFYAAANGDVTIVVSPLKALMTDQVNILRSERHYNRVEFINSDLTLVDRDRIIDECKQGNVDILYLSPELLLSYDIHYFIGERNLGLLIVDEAHLITTWGRDFRVDYWFLGNHINKVRKYNNYMFPLVALTATAVYGGLNDMVFDSINSLNMHDPYKFIGNVRRTNIEFVIDTHDDYTTGQYDQNKETETVDFIKGIHELDMKTIVYAPYTKHINRLKDKCSAIDPNMAVAFHGGMLADEQAFAYQKFRNNNCRVMIATKAFGMGVDIPDIQVVYHHAPSGLLPDYIQEIGRAARNTRIQGFAALTFSRTDLRYSRQLFGISSLKTYQLKEVLYKIIRCYNNNGKKRNLLVSTSDFAYIFDSTDDVDQKVATALMMIEKDYLMKTRFNVLIARPKKLFTKVYARTNQVGLDMLLNNYGDCFKEIRSNSRRYHTIELNLDTIWSNHFSDRSFPQIKSEFYRQKFLEDQGIELTPQIKIVINIDKPYRDILLEMGNVLDAISNSFANFRLRGEFFTSQDFLEKLRLSIGNTTYNVEKIASFILDTYSGNLVRSDVLEGDSFLQRRRFGTAMQYQVFSTNYEAKLSQLRNILSRLFDGKNRLSVERFLSINDTLKINHIRLGSLLELMDLGSFETIGGKDPKIFLRLNDPRRIEKDSKSKNYNNSILDSVKNRHTVSCNLFEHFFTNYFSNEDRWNLIEDFFLGMSNDDLFEKYQGNMVNHIDILKHLKENKSYIPNGEINITEQEQHTTMFLPRKQEFYRRNNILTIGHQTKKISSWLTDDPVALHRTITEYEIRIENDDFRVLINRLQQKHFEYYRDFMRLNIDINYPNDETLVRASIPYKESPVKFYKWWRKNQSKVTMNFEERVKLFLTVDRLDSKALIKAHKELIQKKK